MSEQSARGEPASAPDDGHDATTIRLHWVSAALVATLWMVGQGIDLFPPGPSRVAMRSLHIVLGVAFGCVLACRLWWRTSRVAPPQSSGRTVSFARAGHGLLYALLTAVVGLGLLNAWVRGDQVFGWLRIPALAVAGLDLRHRVGGLHGLVANALLAIAGLHAGAALIHQFVLRDGTLARMLPRR